MLSRISPRFEGAVLAAIFDYQYFGRKALFFEEPVDFSQSRR
jgi:hypothetical protein